MKNILITAVTTVLTITGISYAKLAVYQYNLNHSYVSSPRSKYCYTNGAQDPRLLDKRYFVTLEECGKPLKIQSPPKKSNG